MAASSSSLTLSNFLASLLPPASPPPKSPASLASFPRTATAAAAIALRLESPVGFSEVAFPSARRSSSLWFSSAYNVQVVPEENEPEERLLSRFKREVFRAGVLQECRRRRFFENGHDRRKRKAKEAARKFRKRPQRPSKDSAAKTKEEASRAKKDNEEDDNWDGFNVDLPY